MDDEKIIEILDRFDFGKAIAYMKLVNWTFAGQDITDSDLRTRAWGLLALANANPGHIFEERDFGLVAYKDLADIDLSLYFYIEMKTTIKPN